LRIKLWLFVNDWKTKKRKNNVACNTHQTKQTNWAENGRKSQSTKELQNDQRAFLFCFFFLKALIFYFPPFLFLFLAKLIGIVFAKHKQASRADSTAVFGGCGRGFVTYLMYSLQLHDINEFPKNLEFPART